MTTFYAAAKYAIHDEPEKQWRDLSDLMMVAVELVRIARATGRSLDDVLNVFEDAQATAEYEWEEVRAAGAPTE